MARLTQILKHGLLGDSTESLGYSTRPPSSAWLELKHLSPVWAVACSGLVIVLIRGNCFFPSRCSLSSRVGSFATHEASHLAADSRGSLCRSLDSFSLVPFLTNFRCVNCPWLGKNAVLCLTFPPLRFDMVLLSWECGQLPAHIACFVSLGDHIFVLPLPNIWKQ